MLRNKVHPPQRKEKKKKQIRKTFFTDVHTLTVKYIGKIIFNNIFPKCRSVTFLFATSKIFSYSLPI